MAKMSAGAGQAARPRYFDPDVEVDPLIRRHITLPPFGSGKNDPLVTGASGQTYPVWAVYLNYVSANRDVARTMWNYGDDLNAEQIEAVRRFALAYPDVVMPHVTAALNG